MESIFIVLPFSPLTMVWCVKRIPGFSIAIFDHLVALS
jgi:hypothetical protein